MAGERTAPGRHAAEAELVRAGPGIADPAVRAGVICTDEVRGSPRVPADGLVSCRNSSELTSFACVLIRCLPRLEMPEQLG